MDEELAILEEIIGIIEGMVRNGEEIPPELEEQAAILINDYVDRLESQQQEPIESAVPRGADLLWILSGENPQVFRSYLGSFPDRQLNELAANPARLQQVIERLGQQITTPSGEVSEEGIPKAPLQSSNVYGFQYDPREQKLFVKFQGDGIYEYEGVPPQIFKMFKSGAVAAKTNGRNEYGQWWRGKSPSLGASFHELIKMGGYPYAKVA